MWGAARKASPSRGPSGNRADTCRSQAEAFRGQRGPRPGPAQPRHQFPKGATACPALRPDPQYCRWRGAGPFPIPLAQKVGRDCEPVAQRPHNRPQRWRVKYSATLLQAAGAQISPDPGRPPHHPVFQVRRQFSSLSLASQQGQRATSPEPMGSLHPGLAREPGSSQGAWGPSSDGRTLAEDSREAPRVCAQAEGKGTRMQMTGGQGPAPPASAPSTPNIVVSHSLCQGLCWPTGQRASDPARLAPEGPALARGRRGAGGHPHLCGVRKASPWRGATFMGPSEVRWFMVYGGNQSPRAAASNITDGAPTPRSVSRFWRPETRIEVRGGCSLGTCLGLCLGPLPPSGLSSQASSSLLAYHVYKDTFPKGTASGPRDQYRDMSLGVTPSPTRSTLRRSIPYPIQDSGGDEAWGRKAARGTAQSPPGLPDPGASPHSCDARAPR